MLLVDRCTSRQEKEIKDKILWKCTEYRKQKCPARCHTVAGALVKSSAHIHVAEAAKIEARTVVTNIKERA